MKVYKIEDMSGNTKPTYSTVTQNALGSIKLNGLKQHDILTVQLNGRDLYRIEVMDMTQEQYGDIFEREFLD